MAYNFRAALKKLLNPFVLVVLTDKLEKILMNFAFLGYCFII